MKVTLSKEDLEELIKGKTINKLGIPGHSVCNSIKVTLDRIEYSAISSIIADAERHEKVTEFADSYGNSKKLSESLMQRAREEDNDLKVIGLMTKALREKRLEKFKDMFLEQLSTDNYTVEYMERVHRFTILDTPFGIIDFYPKANKILIRKDNDWKKPGLKWLINNGILKAKSNE